MSGSVEVVVSSCNTCPYFQATRYHCGMLGAPILSLAQSGFTAGSGPPPKWCPLRSATVTLKLDEGR